MSVPAAEEASPRNGVSQSVSPPQKTPRRQFTPTEYLILDLEAAMVKSARSSFPGSAWERANPRLCLEVLPRGGASGKCGPRQSLGPSNSAARAAGSHA